MGVSSPLGVEARLVMPDLDAAMENLDDTPLRRADLSLTESANRSQEAGESVAGSQKRLSKAAKTILKIRAARVMLCQNILPTCFVMFVA